MKKRQIAFYSRRLTSTAVDIACSLLISRTLIYGQIIFMNTEALRKPVELLLAKTSQINYNLTFSVLLKMVEWMVHELRLNYVFLSFKFQEKKIERLMLCMLQHIRLTRNKWNYISSASPHCLFYCHFHDSSERKNKSHHAFYK